jgi:hypothetical protein
MQQLLEHRTGQDFEDPFVVLDELCYRQHTGNRVAELIDILVGFQVPKRFAIQKAAERVKGEVACDL